MLMRKFAATAALSIAALGITAGTVHAEPVAPAPAPVSVSYKVDDEGKSVALTADNGSVAVEDGKLELKNSNGTVMGGIPLAVQVGDFQFPIAADISGATANLAPQIDPEKAVYKPVALPYEDQAPWKSDYDREQAAWNRMKDTIGLGVTAASLVTSLVGGLIGCAVGATVGTAVTLPVVLGGGAGPIVGCLLGGAAGATLIGIVGTIVIAVPVAIASIIQYVQTTGEPHIQK